MLRAVWWDKKGAASPLWAIPLLEFLHKEILIDLFVWGKCQKDCVRFDFRHYLKDSSALLTGMQGFGLKLAFCIWLRLPYDDHSDDRVVSCRFSCAKRKLFCTN
jgi:hypothetical protein